MVLIVERARPSLRGELTRWFVELRSGVFVGNVSGVVRDKLWEKVVKSSSNDDPQRPRPNRGLQPEST